MTYWRSCRDPVVLLKVVMYENLKTPLSTDKEEQWLRPLSTPQTTRRPTNINLEVGYSFVHCRTPRSYESDSSDNEGPVIMTTPPSTAQTLRTILEKLNSLEIAVRSVQKTHEKFKQNIDTLEKENCARSKELRDAINTIISDWRIYLHGSFTKISSRSIKSSCVKNRHAVRIKPGSHGSLLRII